MILFFGNDNKYKALDNIDVEFNNSAKIDSANLIISTKEGLNALPKGTLEKFSDKLLLLYKDTTPKLNPWLAITENEFLTLPSAVLKELEILKVLQKRLRDTTITEEMEKLDKLKSNFLDNVTHEFRTPLNGVLGFSDILLMGDLTPEQKEHIKTIKSCGRLLLSLTNNLIDMTKLESNEYEIEYRDVNIKNTIKDCVESLKPKALEKKFDLRIGAFTDIPDICYGDELKIRQIIHNLLSNAIKFTEKGFVSISAFLKDKHHSFYEVDFVIEDTGIGIPENKHFDISKAFRQVEEDINRDFDGLGLGLTISQKLVHLHGGKLRIKSEVGAGSVFSFSITFLRKKPDSSIDFNYAADNFKEMIKKEMNKVKKS